MQQSGMLTKSCHEVKKQGRTRVSVCTLMHSQRHSVVQGRKVECVYVCVSGSNWDEFVLMGLYGIFWVISVWGLLWRAGSFGGWLGPLPSAAALLHFLLSSFTLVLSHPPSLTGFHFPSLCHERAWVSVCVSSRPASLSALWFSRASGSPSTHPSPLIT